VNTNIELQNAVELYSEGKKESFNQIYELSYKYLHTCVIHVVKDEDIAMDMLQETYLEISKSISQLKNEEGFLNWAATIANRKCYAYLKKQKDIVLYANNEEDENGDFFENIADNEEFIPEAVLQDREKQRLIKDIIDGLTDIQRLCVIGFYYNEQKQDEIAEELGIPVNTVKSHLNRAKAKIKEAVVELDEKKGTRLYSFAPFMLLLFKEEVQACVLKPMTTALASAVGASATAGTTSGIFAEFIAKVKTFWTSATTAVKAKVVVGATVGAVTIGGVAVIMSQPEGEKISLELQRLLDQTIQICETGNYEQLSDLDDEWDALFEQWKDIPNSQYDLHYRFYNVNQQVIGNSFYNGKDAVLQKDYTGYGLGINNNELALGYFENGKAVGELTTIVISDLISIGDDVRYKLYYVTKMRVEDGTIVDNVDIISYVDYEKMYRFEGTVSLVEYSEQLSRNGGYAFTDKVTWTWYDYYNKDEYGNIPSLSEYVLYMNENGTIDRTRHVIENDMIIDDMAGGIYISAERPQDQVFYNIFVSMVYFEGGDEMLLGYNVNYPE